MEDQELLKQIPPLLLQWYDSSARVLPWREDPTPYRVWVSEIMLQQTRVEAVKPFYQRFLEAFPTVEALAAAPEEKLLKMWEGLGYYNRVRNLQRAAQVVVERYSGQVPCSFEELRALPGIGEYTAGAIASIAFQLPVPAVDGNVLRVISRVLARFDNILDPKVKRRMEGEIREILPQRVGDFNQSLMELGATVLFARGPAQVPGLPPPGPVPGLCPGRGRRAAGEDKAKAPEKTGPYPVFALFPRRAGGAAPPAGTRAAGRAVGTSRDGGRPLPGGGGGLACSPGGAGGGVFPRAWGKARIFPCGVAHGQLGGPERGRGAWVCLGHPGRTAAGVRPALGF